MSEKLVIGKIVNTIGLKGDLRVFVPDCHKERFLEAKNVCVDGFEGKFEVEKAKFNGKNFTLKLKKFNDINKVECFKNKDIFLPLDEGHELANDEFLIRNLIGCKIVGDTIIGKVVDVENYGAGDIIVFVDTYGDEYRVPFNYDYFSKIDFENYTLYITNKFIEGAVEK